MYCRICGKSIPDDSHFCPYCGQTVSDAANLSVDQPAASEAGSACSTKVFAFPSSAPYDQAAAAINDWLNGQHLKILDARFTLDAELLAGVIVPRIKLLELDWQPDPDSASYCIGIMLGNHNSFGLGRKKNAQRLNRQYDRWRQEHPELEVAALQEHELSLGWTSASATLFFHRQVI